MKKTGRTAWLIDLAQALCFLYASSCDREHGLSIDAGDAASGDAAPSLYTSSGRPKSSACLRQAGSFVGPNDYVYTVHWSPTADYLLTGTIGALRLLAVDLAAEMLSEVSTFSQDDSLVYAQWSPDGRYALSAGDDVRLVRVELEPAQISEVARYSGHDEQVIALAWSPDGQFALTGSKDETVRVLAVEPAQARLRERAVFRGHVGRVFAVTWSPDGRHALSLGEDRTMRVLAFDADGGTLRELAQERGVDWKNSAAWSDGDRPVLSGDWGLFNQVTMWSVDVAGERVVSLGILTEFDHVGVQVLEWNRAGDMLAAAAHDDNGLQLFSYAERRFAGLGRLQRWKYGVHAASWSRDGSYLAFAASRTERITLLDVRDCRAAD